MKKLYQIGLVLLSIFLVFLSCWKSQKEEVWLTFGQSNPELVACFSLNEPSGKHPQVITIVKYSNFQFGNFAWKKCSLPPQKGHSGSFLSKPKVKQDIQNVFWWIKKVAIKNTGNDYSSITCSNCQKIGTTKAWKNRISSSLFNLEKYPIALFDAENQSNKYI